MSRWLDYDVPPELDIEMKDAVIEMFDDGKLAKEISSRAVKIANKYNIKGQYNEPPTQEQLLELIDYQEKAQQKAENIANVLVKTSYEYMKAGVEFTLMLNWLTRRANKVFYDNRNVPRAREQVLKKANEAGEQREQLRLEAEREEQEAQNQEQELASQMKDLAVDEPKDKPAE